VVIHQKDTSVADRAMVCSDWLYVVTRGAFLLPCILKRANGFASVPQQFLGLLADSFESVIIHVLHFAFLLYCLQATSVFSLFQIFPQLLYFLYTNTVSTHSNIYTYSQIFWTTWLNEGSKEVIIGYVVDQG
jgi:hypothetical protein